MVQEIGGDQGKTVDQGVQRGQTVLAGGGGAEAAVAARTSGITQRPPTEEASIMAGVDRLQGMGVVDVHSMKAVFAKYLKTSTPGDVFTDQFFHPYYALAGMLTTDLGLPDLRTMINTSAIDQALVRAQSGQYDLVSHVEQRLTAGHTLQDIILEIDHLIKFIEVCVEIMKQERYSIESASKALQVLEIYKSAIESRIRKTTAQKEE